MMKARCGYQLNYFRASFFKDNRNLLAVFIGTSFSVNGDVNKE